MMNDRPPIGIPSSDDKPPLGTYKHQYQVIGDRVHEIKNVVVHTFSMGDVEDPDLYAAEPLMKWQNSESGSWVMSHSVEQPMWHRHADPTSYGYKYAVTAKLLAKDYTYWSLKWGSFIDNKQF
jgi:hypothetical protein